MTPVALSTAAWIFIGIPLLVIYALGIVDIVRRDIPAGTKAAWILIVLILPVVGTITYFVLRKPTEAEARRSREAAADLGREWPGPPKRRLPGE